MGELSTQAPTTLCRLFRRGDRVCLRQPGTAEPIVGVKVMWARPLSGRGAEVCFTDSAGHEVLMLNHLDELDPASREIATEELSRRYCIATIHRVLDTSIVHRHYYWSVITDRGRRCFLVKNMVQAVTWLKAGHLVIRDVMGNRFEIPSVAGLDASSRRALERVL